MLGWVALGCQGGYRVGHDGGAGTARFVADSIDSGCSMFDPRWQQEMPRQEVDISGRVGGSGWEDGWSQGQVAP